MVYLTVRPVDLILPARLLHPSDGNRAVRMVYLSISPAIRIVLSNALREFDNVFKDILAFNVI